MVAILTGLFATTLTGIERVGATILVTVLVPSFSEDGIVTAT